MGNPFDGLLCLKELYASALTELPAAPLGMEKPRDQPKGGKHLYCPGLPNSLA